MKKIKSLGKLSLNKEKITRLNNVQLNHVRGGEEDNVVKSRRSGCPAKPCTLTAN